MATHSSSHVQKAHDVVPSYNPLTGFLDQFTQQLSGPDETARVKQKREALLADLCTRLVDWYHPSEGMTTPEMAAAAKVAILDELGTLAIDEMPQSELSLRGTVIRNRILAPYLRQQQEEKDRQLTRDKEERRRSAQDAARQARQTTRKAVLIELAVSRALKAGSSRGIPPRVFPLLEWEVRGRLETLLTRIEQLQRSEQERFLDECLALATPIAVASWPWMKDTLIQQLCEQFGIQVAPQPDMHTNEERASAETSSAPANAEQSTRRPVRRRRVRPSGPTLNPDEMAGTSEPVEPTSPERKRAVS
jgi:hypothetical protein